MLYLASVDALRVRDLDAFSVLMLLCKDGRTPAILAEIVERLLKQKDQRKESLSAAIFFAGKVFQSQEDLLFLERTKEMLQDSLRDSWTYQKVLGEGRAEGREEGRIEEARQNIALLVEENFPTLLVWVQVRVEEIADLEALRKIVRVVGRASTEDEVRAAFPPQH